MKVYEYACRYSPNVIDVRHLFIYLIINVNKKAQSHSSSLVFGFIRLVLRFIYSKYFQIKII